MVKNFMKKIIIFIIPFLFILNVNTEEINTKIIYYYKTENANYSVVVDIEKMDYQVYVQNSTTTGVADNYVAYDYNAYYELNSYYLGVYDYSDFLKSLLNYPDNLSEQIDEIKSNPEKYKPILLFNEKNESVVLWHKFVNICYSGFPGNKSEYNLNEIDSDVFKKLFSGDYQNICLDNDDSIANTLNINVDNIPSYVRFKSYSVDSEEKKNNNSSVTGGTCLSEAKKISSLIEKIQGDNNSSGVCSSKSLNELQKNANLYSVNYFFDKTILEKECMEYIYGSNGLIKAIEDGGIFYESLDNYKKNSISCLSLQSAYLSGISLLTNFTPYVDNAKIDACKLISDDAIDFINNLFDIFKIICICICIYLCIIDVYKMIVTKESDVSKIKTVLIKRIIALVAVFLIPLFVNIVTELINDRYLKNNGEKCSNIIRK